MSRGAVLCCSHVLMLWYGGSLSVKRCRIVLLCVDVMVRRVVVCQEEPYCVVVMC